MLYRINNVGNKVRVPVILRTQPSSGITFPEDFISDGIIFHLAADKGVATENGEVVYWAPVGESVSRDGNYEETFEGSSIPTGWEVQFGDTSDWSMENGTLKHVHNPETPSDQPSALVWSEKGEIADCDITCEFNIEGRVKWPSIIVRGKGSTGNITGYVFEVMSDGDYVRIKKYQNKSYTIISENYLQYLPTPMTIATNVWYKMRAYIWGNRLKFKVWPASNPEPSEWLIQTADNIYNSLQQGFIGVYDSRFGDFASYFRNFHVKSSLKGFYARNPYPDLYNSPVLIKESNKQYIKIKEYDTYGDSLLFTRGVDIDVDKHTFFYVYRKPFTNYGYAPLSFPPIQITCTEKDNELYFVTYGEGISTYPIATDYYRNNDWNIITLTRDRTADVRVDFYMNNIQILRKYSRLDSLGLNLKWFQLCTKQDVAEIIIYNRVLSREEIRLVNGYLANKYGIFIYKDA